MKISAKMFAVTVMAGALVFVGCNKDKAKEEAPVESQETVSESTSAADSELEAALNKVVSDYNDAVKQTEGTYSDALKQAEGAYSDALKEAQNAYSDALKQATQN